MQSKIINNNNIYCCMIDVENTIKSQNKKYLKPIKMKKIKTAPVIVETKVQKSL